MATTKFDLKQEATRPLYAGVGVTDLAVGAVRDYVADVHKRFEGVQKNVAQQDAAALRQQAAEVVSARVDALSKDAKALPARVQKLVDDNVATAGTTYDDLVKRGETLVGRIRGQESTKATTASAKTTTAKAKTTKTQATKATKATAKSTAKKASTTAKKRSTAPKSSAKATATAAKKTASKAATAATDAAAKVGD